MRGKDAMTVQWSSTAGQQGATMLQPWGSIRHQSLHCTPHHSRTLRLTTLRSFDVQAEHQRTGIVSGFTSPPPHCTPHHSRTHRLTTLQSFAVQAECQRTAIIHGFTSLPPHPHLKFSEKLVGMVVRFNSWVGFSIWNGIFTLFLTETDSIDNMIVNSVAVPFNDAYRYMDWSLTVPLPLIEILLVMKLDDAEVNSKSWSLGSSAAMTIVACYHGESVVTSDLSPHWICCFVSMIFSCYILYELLVGPATATAQEADPKIRSKIQIAQVMTVTSWYTYPVAYLSPTLRINTGAAVGYEPIVSAAVVCCINCNWLQSALSDVRYEGECLAIANLNFSS